MPYEIYPTPNQQLMEDAFHKWLDQCPNNWLRIDVEQGKESAISATYKFYRNDNGGDDE